MKHKWIQLMVVPLTTDQARRMNNKETAGVSPWNVQNTVTIGPGCRVCGVDFQDAGPDCPGMTEKGRMLHEVFGLEIPTNPTTAGEST